MIYFYILFIQRRNIPHTYPHIYPHMAPKAPPEKMGVGTNIKYKKPLIKLYIYIKKKKLGCESLDLLPSPQTSCLIAFTLHHFFIKAPTSFNYKTTLLPCKHIFFSSFIYFYFLLNKKKGKRHLNAKLNNCCL